MNFGHTTLDTSHPFEGSIVSFIQAANPRDPTSQAQFPFLIIDAGEENAAFSYGAGVAKQYGITELWHRPKSYEANNTSSAPRETENWIFQYSPVATGRSLYHYVPNTWAYIQAPQSQAVSQDDFMSAFQRASDEAFENGMESTLSLELERLVWNAGELAETYLTNVTGDPTVPEDAVAEGLKWTGRSGGPLPQISRIRLLENGLKSRRATIRDAAVLGFSFLSDPAAIPSLSEALAAERSPELREDMEYVITQLRTAKPCHDY